jgi:hypothetical protein
VDTAGGRRLKNASPTKEKKEWVCELSEADAAVADANIIRIDGIDDDFIEANGIESGDYTVLFQEETLETNRMVVANTMSVTIGESEQKKAKKAKSDQGRRDLAAGPLSVLVVRVNNSSDGRKTSASASQLADDIFDDAVSLKSQYAACSYGELTFEKATGNNIVNGVVSVNLNTPVSGVESSTVRSRMQSAADALVGFNVQQAFDHVMFCIPPDSVDDGNAGW